MNRPTGLPSKAALRAERRALRERLRERVAAQRNHPALATALARRRKRRQRALAIAACILLLLLALMRCECDPPPPPAPVVTEPVTAPLIGNTTPAPPKKPKRALKGTIEASDRGAMAVEPTEAPAWLQQFRLQVAARSPKLAACFNGAERPGALRWSALVHAQSGRVSESVVEPVFRGVELDQEQHDCLVARLTETPFKLDEPSPQAAARRVSLIFEF